MRAAPHSAVGVRGASPIRYTNESRQHSCADAATATRIDLQALQHECVLREGRLVEDLDPKRQVVLCDQVLQGGLTDKGLTIGRRVEPAEPDKLATLVVGQKLIDRAGSSRN